MPDPLNDIGVLRRREIEARIVAPLLRAFAAEIGEARAREIARRVIVEIAERQGEALAERAEARTPADLLRAMEPWTRDGALELKVLNRSDTELSFDVTRCRYAEMYRSLGMPELGELLSCNRDFAWCRGFNPDLDLTRTQTIMRGARHCDFRFRMRGSGAGESSKSQGPSLQQAPSEATKK